MEIRKLRRISQVIDYVKINYNVTVSRFILEGLCINNKMDFYRDGKIFYLYLDSTIECLKREGIIGELQTE